MTSKLSDFKISSWILTIDILGTAQRMSEPNWFDSLLEILNASLISVAGVVPPYKGNTPKIFQYGDSLSLCHDDPDVLVIIAIETMKKYINVGILAQMGISGYDTYYIENSTLHSLVRGHKDIHLQLLVGPGMARSHLITKGLKGPHVVIDEESGSVPSRPGVWEKVICCQPPENRSKITISEVWWWRDTPEIKHQIQELLDDAKKELDDEEKELAELRRESSYGSYRQIERLIVSLESRVDHLQTFLKRWACVHSLYEGSSS